MRKALYAAIAVLSMGVAMLSALPAQAVQTPQPTLVSAKPVDWTPAVNDGAVRAIIQVGSTIVLGGTFTSVTPAGSTTAQTRNYILAFNSTTGVLSSFAPTLDGPVDALVAGTDGQSVYVGGEFSNVNGVKAKSLVKLNLNTGATITSFKTVAINGNVLDLKLSGPRLWVGGNFSKFATFNQTALATVDATTGKYDPFDQVQFSGLHNGGTTSLQKFDITPDGSRLLAIGNFTSVNGVAHNQAVMLDLTGPSATLANWATSFYNGSCSNSFDSYMRDLDISPDGTYVVVSTTGAYGGSTSPCDETSRWEMNATGTSLTPTWTDYTGGDTTYAVAITGTAVYVGGHFRWVNNAFAGDRAGAGAVAREGIAALDPKTGLPLDWDPGRARGVGVFDMLATNTGLWVGSDTDRIGGWTIHPKIAFFPLPGGAAVPTTNTVTLPGQVYLGGNTAATASNVLYRVDAAGPTLASLDGGPDWSSDTDTTNPLRNTGSNVAGYASGATANSTVPPSTPNAIFDTERWDPTGGNEMQWSFPVTTGTHVQVHLYFANRCTCTASVGQRKFNVSINGSQVLSSFDIVADAHGTNIGEMRSFNTVAVNGAVTISFGHVVENPLVNGIELINSDAPVSTTNDDIVTRTFDGTSVGATTTLPSTGISWSQARGAFYANGIVYAGMSDGNLYARPFDGTTFGTPVNVNGMDSLAVLSDFHNDVKNMTGMFFDSSQNRLYFTLANTNALYYRYFEPMTNVVGAIRYTATNTSGLDFSKTSAMFPSGGNLYVGDKTTGNLVKVQYSGSTVSGTPTAVSGPTLDGSRWVGRAVFVAPVPGAPNVPPTAAFTSQCQADQCLFDASGSGDSDGSISSYTWDFGDGQTAASSQPQHIYSSTGTFNVKLTVTDNGGDSTSVTHQVSVASANMPPTATFTSNCSALSCTFDGSGSTDSDGTIASYEWDFGDGTTSQDITPTHVFGSEGSYSVTLDVTDDDGAVSTSTQQVTVSQAAAAIGFVGGTSATGNAAKISVTVPAAVTAGNGLVLVATEASSTGTMTAPTGFTEVDSVVGSGIQTHIYQSVATGTSAGSTVTVNLPAVTKATLTLSAYSGTSSTSPIAADAIRSETTSSATHTTPTLTTSMTGAWLVSSWSDVSAGTTGWTTPSGQTVRASGAGANAAHTSSVLSDLNGPLSIGTVGGYAATASSASAKATMATMVLAPDGAVIPNQPPVASFTKSCSGLACDFNAGGSSDPDGSIASYAWTFGDGATSTVVAPSHTYSAGGSYSVTLKVTDNDGAVDTSTQQVTVNASASNIAYVGSASSTANAGKISVTVPAAVTSGNALVLIASAANTTTTLTAPAGWATVDSVVGTQSQTQVWQQVATGASAGSTVSVTLSAAAKASLMVAAYSGTASSSPVVAHAITAETASTATHVTPTLSTSAAGAWLLSYWSDVSTDTTTFTTPAGQAARAQVAGSGGGHVSSVLTDLGGPLNIGTVGGYSATALGTPPTPSPSAKAAMLTLVLASS